MTTQNASQFFDLHTSGIGYINRIRLVEPKKGEPFWACSIAALRGDTNNVEYTYFDVRVSGTEAARLIARCQQAVEAGSKMLISFKIGDIYPDVFTYASGDRKGETGVSLKGRLLMIRWIKKDGEMIYQMPKADDASGAPADTAGTPGANAA
ncbi:STY4534 family ICE replication protein [Pokkaliibacter sp. MBI-7]|uniref:STY4534 family ICE replication protein n=1 Tax=Pokkaliibacter sp. MBI-7 TaxID=3040600 RepID=UPI002449EDA2|nr:STY4534 family ICE replication protein [Pokkaliibacter sp. MBI-7]MDH2431004.1 STY4534 family ICE replication protein [Pokkaliibacter sp. MBI-7]MDH2436699.1 STY4534 family ICE replication protein [Pokkaliibacter sp. MBI-7]MDH2436799.1 STY4534 family ICE replication protein [Pokkaliibacter sp. MBI-7]